MRSTTVRKIILPLMTIAAIAAMSGAASAASRATLKRNEAQRAGSGTEIRLTASAGTVAYYSNGKFKAVYRERINNEQLRQDFKFEVEAFTPNAEVPVTVNGQLVATAIVDPLGRGEFQFSAGDNNPGDDLPLPGGFPRLRAGDTITIGNLTAVFH